MIVQRLTTTSSSRRLVSVFEQGLSAEDVEVIVVDDGFTDNTSAVVRKFTYTRREAEALLTKHGLRIDPGGFSVGWATSFLIAFRTTSPIAMFGNRTFAAYCRCCFACWSGISAGICA